MKYRLARLYSFVVRFRTLQFANCLFGSALHTAILRRSIFGYQIALNVARSSAQRLLYLEGERFVIERGIIMSLLRPGMTVVDIGANIGYYLLMFERCVGPRGRVICIEPSVENLPELRLNAHENGFTNVSILPVAVGASHGEVGLLSGINSGVVGIEEGTYKVPVEPLDNLVTGPIHVVKIDVEGNEGQVLIGAQALLREYHPIVFMEVHPHLLAKFGFTTKALFALLRETYEDITLWERREGESGLMAKVAVRYLGRTAVSTIPAASSHIAKCDSGEINETFWVVCR